MTAQPQASPPPSVTNMWINLTGLLVSLLALVWVREFGQSLSNTAAMVLLCLALAVPIIVLEWLFLKPYRNASAGLKFDWTNTHWNVRRAFIKLYGFYATIGLVALVYWTLPEYHGNFYGRYYDALRVIMPVVLVIAVPYFLLIDRFMVNPKDSYWQFGRCLTGRTRQVEGRVIGQHMLGWLVKLYFLPLMFIYMSNNLGSLRTVELSTLLTDQQALADFAYTFLYYIDLLIVTVGYACTIRLFDAHIRTTEPSFLGWVVALMCYQPFWGAISGNYLRYNDGRDWFNWIQDPIMMAIWGGAIITLIGIYVWASIPFGIRFSNLTHRGILTNGPYRYTKHPAYVSKNLSWWLISVPFLSTAGFDEALRHSLLLLLVNLIYLMRARTEERHLSWDPTYVAYAKYIERHGLFARVGRWLPLLKFKPGRLFNVPDNKN